MGNHTHTRTRHARTTPAAAAAAAQKLISVDKTAPPVLDLTAPEAELVAAVRAACERWGFFQVQGHGVRPELRARFEAAMRDFFALDAEEKLRVERSATNARG